MAVAFHEILEAVNLMLLTRPADQEIGHKAGAKSAAEVKERVIARDHTHE